MSADRCRYILCDPHGEKDRELSLAEACALASASSVGGRERLAEHVGTAVLRLHTFRPNVVTRITYLDPLDPAKRSPYEDCDD